MELVKTVGDYKIYKKRSDRYAIRDASRKWISGEEKVKILVAEKLLDVPLPKAKPPEEPAEEAPETAASEEAEAEGAAEESTE